MMNTKAVIVYNGIHSQQIAVRDGAPQGGMLSGNQFNIYMVPPVDKCLEVTKTISYGMNLAASSFSDDVVKVAGSRDEMQCMFDAESCELEKINMGVNPEKSKVVQYTRKRKKIAVFGNEPALELRGQQIIPTRKVLVAY